MKENLAVSHDAARVEEAGRALRVWAPGARRVELMTGGRLHAMQRGEGGWWHAPAEAIAPPGDYSFALDGGAPLPDPRSPWQPSGVGGPSRRVDHGAFAWSDRGWQAPPLASAIVYEVHVGTFTPRGTFEAAIERLDHLVDLGVTHVELMPVAEFSGARGWGYDGVHLFAPHHRYGGPEGLKRLVDACHARGLAVLLDVVYNHLGPVGNSLAQFGPYFTDRHQTPWGAAVNFDGPGSDEVRRFVVDNALSWLRDYHFDGLRLDAIHAIVDTSAVHVVEELVAEVEALGAALGRHLVVIAESDLNDPRVIRPRALGGHGADAQWSDDFHHALHVALTGESTGYYADFGGLDDLARALERGFVYDGRHSAHRGRCHGRPLEGVSGHRLLGYLQNHDQIGNRARGDRSSHLLSPGHLAVAAAIVLTSPFVPLLFQGEEWGATTPFLYFTDHADPDLARAVREGRRREFAGFEGEVPDPQAEETFARSKLRWEETRSPRHKRLLEWHRALIRLRRSAPELSDGRLDRVRARAVAAPASLVIERGDWRIVCNLDPGPRSLPLDGPDARWSIALASEPGARIAGGAIELPAESAAVLRREVAS